MRVVSCSEVLVPRLQAENASLTSQHDGYLSGNLSTPPCPLECGETRDINAREKDEIEQNNRKSLV